MEKEVKLEVYLVRYYCDEEGCDGEVESKRWHSMTNDLEHKCNKCGKKHIFDKKVKYPIRRYKEVETSQH